MPKHKQQEPSDNRLTLAIRFLGPASSRRLRTAASTPATDPPDLKISGFKLPWIEAGDAEAAASSSRVMDMEVSQSTVTQSKPASWSITLAKHAPRGKTRRGTCCCSKVSCVRSLLQGWIRLQKTSPGAVSSARWRFSACRATQISRRPVGISCRAREASVVLGRVNFRGRVLA